MRKLIHEIDASKSKSPQRRGGGQPPSLGPKGLMGGKISLIGHPWLGRPPAHDGLA